MIPSLTKYQHIIKDIKIIRFRKEENLSAFIAIIFFIDGSELHIREYLFNNGERKYSFHWMGKDKKLIIRWDNAPHWKKVSTFPHHKHMGSTLHVENSREITTESVLFVINLQIGKR